MKIVNYLTSLFILSIILLNLSCNKRSSCPEELYDITKESVTSYHQQYFPQTTLQKKSDNFSIYIDFSSGMKVAFKDANSSDFYQLFINSLKMSKVDFYEVASGNVQKFPDFNTAELYKHIKNTKKYTKINAPLNKALFDIVKNGKEAVFITDGELWRNEERDDPWAREEFSVWLKKGNKIEFYVTDHTDAGKEKHIFYMFFIPKNIQNSSESITEQFKYYIDNSVEAQNMKFTHFSFSNSGLEIIQEYETATSGGANLNAELDAETYINKGKEAGFEYHRYYLTWEGMVEYILNAYDDNTGKPIAGGAPLISNLFIKTETLEFYTIKQLGVKVHDVKDDLIKYLKCKECRDAEKPTYLTDENGNKELDEQNNPILDYYGDENCYDQETAKLIVDTIFKKQDKLPEVTELLTFDQTAFENNLKEEGRGEIVIKIDKNFTGSQLSAECNNIHRVDVYLKKVESNTQNLNLTKFIWEGKQVKKNRSMYNSILGALNDANPEGIVIYSYYIVTEANDYFP